MLNNNLFWRLRTDSFAYSRKRKETTRAFLTSVVSIFLALIVALLIATAMGYNPFLIISRLFTIGFEDPNYLFYKIGVFVTAGFSFYFAWKAGIINIGISGQMLLSGTIIVLITQALGDKVPNGAGQILILIIAMLISSMTATFVGVLQTYLRVNAVVSAILLNWIIYFISFYVLATFTVSGNSQFSSSGEIPLNYCFVDTQTKTGGIIPIIIIVFILTVLMIIIFKFTVFGHKIKSVGLSTDASLYAGYNTKLICLSSYAISGAISGILACICYTSSSVHAIPLSTFFDAIPTEGFDGIMISLVGNSNPIGILIVSGLFGLFGASAQGLPTDPSFNNVIIGCVLLGSAMSVLISKLKPWIKLNSFKYDLNYYETQLTFDNSIDSLLSKYYSIYTTDKHLLKQFKKINKMLINDPDNNDLINERNEIINKFAINKNYNHKDLNKIWKGYQINLLHKYLNEKHIIKEKFAYQKVIDLINSRLLTTDLINEKTQLIEHKYDFRLTKYINKIKQKYIENHQKNNEEVFNKKRELAIQKNNGWKTRAIDKMIKHQNRYLTNSNKFQMQIKKINLAVNKIKNQAHLDEINKLLISINANNVTGGE